MHESNIAPTSEECARDCLILKTRLARKKTNGELATICNPLDRPDALPIEEVLGADTDFALEFVDIMSKQGMPGAKVLCVESCEAKPFNIFGKMIGLGPNITKGAAIYGYAIGALKVTRESAWRGTAYLCGDGRVRVHEDTTSYALEGDAEIVTELDQNTIYFGKVCERADNPDEQWSRYFVQNSLSFREMPLRDVLLEIATEQLNAD